MKAVRQALIAKLLAEATVTARVGTRVYPMIRPQSSTLPAIVVERVAGGHDPGMRGHDEMPAPQFAVTSWADSTDAADALAGVVFDVIDDAGPETWGSGGAAVAVTSATYLDESDVAEEKPGGNDQYAYGVRQIYEVQHEEEG